MSEKGLKIVPGPEAKQIPPQPKSGIGGQKSFVARKGLRMILLVIVPALVLIIGGVLYLSGGRYISTDNAFVGAQKVLITPDIAGKINHVAVREGQHVSPGDELFTLDQQPYALALKQAKGKLDAARSEFEKLKTSLVSLNALADLAAKNVDLKRHDVERKSRLVKSQAGSEADLDAAQAAVVNAELQAQQAIQQRDTAMAELLGNPNLPLEEFPEYAQAKAALENAQRDYEHTIVRAPISGTATQVEKIQLGRYVSAGTPIMSIIDDAAPWVDANPKETDITYLRVGQKATIEVDSYPDRTFTGTVVAVSPGTGAQFSILPPENATGNWVKVVQRVPVRIVFDNGEDTHLLRAGMSVTVDIDTGHRRWPFTSANAKE
ncbi:MAG TPA: HlyD family secretion protein [Pseudolabrys sp.]|nr:HlyD family secretion protein [Pseudolabrys sp.]